MTTEPKDAQLEALDAAIAVFSDMSFARTAAMWTLTASGHVAALREIREDVARWPRQFQVMVDWCDTLQAGWAMCQYIGRLAKPAQGAVPVEDWRQQASAWLIREAEEQEQTNRDCPSHVKAYPEWEERPRRLRIMADRVLKAANPSPPADGGREAVPASEIEWLINQTLAGLGAFRETVGQHGVSEGAARCERIRTMLNTNREAS